VKGRGNRGMSFDWMRGDRRLSRRGSSSISDTGREVVPALGGKNSAAVRRGGVMERVRAAAAAKAGLNVAGRHTICIRPTQ
jgi:hypothetical protein